MLLQPFNKMMRKKRSRYAHWGNNFFTVKTPDREGGEGETTEEANKRHRYWL